MLMETCELENNFSSPPDWVNGRTLPRLCSISCSKFYSSPTHFQGTREKTYLSRCCQTVLLVKPLFLGQNLARKKAVKVEAYVSPTMGDVKERKAGFKEKIVGSAHEFPHGNDLLRKGASSVFIDLVRSADTEAARVGLQFMELVLRGMPNGEGPKLVEREDGIDAMERFQFHENEDLRNMANGLVDKYFGEDYGLDE
ncbi:hypothetical protein SLEP1_g57832 [Rubroshorea leprosula]|uniref:Uncharacterized protein n=1 Tax=Rubroshorea leprosula TaxID=152421 RepID=A0AAV5MMP7_9ROSI|nr:hypothetical protein SLEP1_g57832 [Rubroshorea leprosula]